MPILGHNSIGASSFPDSSATPIYAQFTAGSSFTASRMFAYVDSASGTINLTMGIYADASGSIGSLLRTTVESPSVTTTPGWVECDLASPLSIASGTTYWLGVNHGFQTMDFFFDTAAASSQFSIDSYVGGTMPSPPSSPGTLATTDLFSIYAQDAASPMPPTLGEGTVPSAGNVLTATLSESGVTPASGTGLFTVAGTAATVATYSITGTTLTLSFGGLVRSGETVTLSYTRTMTGADLVDGSSLALATFSAAATINSSTQVTPTAQLVCAGDSITYGYPGTGQGTIGGATWEAATFAALGPSWTGNNDAQDGTTFASDETFDQVTVDLQYDGSLAHNVLVGGFGTNDCVALSTGALVYAAMLTWLGNRRAANPGWAIIIPTVMPALTGGAATTFEGVRAAYNTLLRANYQSLGITLCDIAQDARMGAPGAQANTTYFVDATHPTDLGRQILGEYYAAAIWQALLPVVSGGSGGVSRSRTFAG